jgi:hypothetical protein
LPRPSEKPFKVILEAGFCFKAMAAAAIAERLELSIVGSFEMTEELLKSNKTGPNPTGVPTAPEAGAVSLQGFTQYFSIH